MTDSDVSARCYFCGAEPVCYVRWEGTRHYGFLCATHLDEHGEHMATKYRVDYGVRRIAEISR